METLDERFSNADKTMKAVQVNIKSSPKLSKVIMPNAQH